MLIHFENLKHYTYVYFYLNIGKHSDMHTLGVKIHDSLWKLCELLIELSISFDTFLLHDNLSSIYLACQRAH